MDNISNRRIDDTVEFTAEQHFALIERIKMVDLASRKQPFCFMKITNGGWREVDMRWTQRRGNE